MSCNGSSTLNETVDIPYSNHLDHRSIACTMILNTTKSSFLSSSEDHISGYECGLPLKYRKIPSHPLGLPADT